MSTHASVIHSHEGRVISVTVSAPCQRSWLAFMSPATVATVRAILKHPKCVLKYIRFCRHCIAIVLIPACSQNNAFPLSYKHSESKAKYTEALENSGWKAPHEVSRPTASPKQTELRGQTTLFRGPSTLLFKASTHGGYTNSRGKLFDCLTILRPSCLLTRS